MASNKEWATAADPADVVVPTSGLRAAGYAFKGKPSHENFNWLLQQYGAGIIRRYASLEAMIASEDDLGYVQPVAGAGEDRPFGYGFTAQEAGTVRVATDGAWLYAVIEIGANAYALAKIDRSAGTEEATSAGTRYYPAIALGRHVYQADRNTAITRVWAHDRETLASVSGSYYIALAGDEAVTDMVCDGRYIYVCAGTKIYKLDDNGSALSIVTSYDNGVAFTSIDTDGYSVVAGGNVQLAGDSRQIRTFTNGLTLLESYSLVDAAIVRGVKMCGPGRIAYISDPDEYSPGNFYYGGFLRNLDGGIGLLWNWTLNARSALAWTGEHVVFAGLDGKIYFVLADTVAAADPTTAVCVDLEWDGGAATEVLWLCCDEETLFVTGDDDAGSKNLKSVLLHTDPRLFAALADGVTHYTVTHARAIRCR